MAHVRVADFIHARERSVKLFDAIERRCAGRVRFQHVDVPPTQSGPSDLRWVLDHADLCVLCTPSLFQATDAGGDAGRSLELMAGLELAIGGVSAGAPCYHSFLVARAGAPGDLEALRGSRFVFNDCLSLSGLGCVRLWLHERGLPADFFGSMSPTGSHAASVRAVADGAADCAAIDARVWRQLERDGNAHLPKLRVLGQALGPFPSPPFAAGSWVPPDVRACIRAALLSLHDSEDGRAALEGLLAVRFHPVDDQALAALAARLRAAAACEAAASERTAQPAPSGGGDR